MEIIIFFSILIAVLAVLTSIILVRRIKKQIAEMTDALMDVKMEMVIGASCLQQMNW